MYPHRIRLRGPWECEPLARADDGPLPPPCRVTMPCRWTHSPLGPFAGRARVRRRFGYPGRIDPHERVWLTFTAADRDATVWLNGELLGRHRGAFEPFEFEVTERLQARNELVLELESPSTGGLWGDVALEVRCTAFLSAPRLSPVWRGRPSLGVECRIVGAEVGLEVYVLVNGRTLHYASGLDASPEGVAFRAAFETPDVGPWQPRTWGRATLCPVRLDLIKGGALWFAWEGDVGFRDVEDLGPDVVQINGRELTLEALSGATGNYHGICAAEAPIATDVTQAHCDREGILMRQALPRPTGDPAEDETQAAALVAQLHRHPCILGFVPAVKD